MRIEIYYEVAEKPGDVGMILTTPGDICAMERKFNLEIGNVLENFAMEPFLFMLHNAIMREAAHHPDRWPDGVLPFEAWVNDSLIDFDLGEVVELRPKSGIDQRSSTREP